MNLSLQFCTVGDKLELREARLLADMNHASQPLRRRIGKDVDKIRWNRFRPDSDSTAEALQPDLTPILTQWPRQQLEVTEHLEPFVKVQLEILFKCRANEATTPASSSAVRNGAADGTTR